MSNVNVRVLDEYTEEAVERFNDTIEKYLESEVEDDKKNAVAYFYLLAHRLEECPKVDDYYVNNKLRIMVGKVLTVIDAVVVDSQQNKATKDIIRQDYYRLCAKVNVEVGGDEKFPTPVPEEKESDPL